MQSTQSLTMRALCQTQQFNTQGGFARWVAAPVMGSVVTAGASLIDAAREGSIGSYAVGKTLCYNVRRLEKRAKAGEEALMHLRQSGKHFVGVIIALAVGIFNPAGLLMPAMRSVGFDVATATKTFSFKRAVMTAAGLAGVAFAMHSFGPVLLAWKATMTTPATPKFSWPLVAKIGVALVGSHLIAQKLVSKSEYGPISGSPIDNNYHRAAEIPFLGTASIICGLIQGTFGYVATTLPQLFTRDLDTWLDVRDEVMPLIQKVGISLIKAVPFAAIYLHNRTVQKMNIYILVNKLTRRVDPNEQNAVVWHNALLAELAGRSLKSMKMEVFKSIYNHMITYEVPWLETDIGKLYKTALTAELADRQILTVSDLISTCSKIELTSNRSPDQLNQETTVAELTDRAGRSWSIQQSQSHFRLKLNDVFRDGPVLQDNRIVFCHMDPIYVQNGQALMDYLTKGDLTQPRPFLVSTKGSWSRRDIS